MKERKREKVKDILFRYITDKRDPNQRDRTKEEERIKRCEKFSHTKRGNLPFCEIVPLSYPCNNALDVRIRISPRYIRLGRTWPSYDGESICPLSKRSRARSRCRINVANFEAEDSPGRARGIDYYSSFFSKLFFFHFLHERTTWLLNVLRTNATVDEQVCIYADRLFSNKRTVRSR